MRLNLGSGQRPFGEGWTNVDCQSKWSPDIVADIRNMPMFEDGSAELIVVHHGLEHLKITDAAIALKEWHRILKPEGSLLIFVPDLKALARKWLVGNLTDYLFFVNCMGADCGDPSDLHRWHYTRESLTMELAKAGFSHSKPFDWREIPGADIARDFWVLGWEAIK